jgi:3-methylcrotonyl-CoA carboxylase alpha subunit
VGDPEVMPEMFEKILIANRGEIACRIIRTCVRLCVRSVAVYSDADSNSLHVRLANQVIHIGGSPASESYLAGDRILAAAKRSGASAIHPGYGFLAENASFAEACEREGLVFIGPPASAIRAMGSKSTAKALMEAAGVPLTPGYHGENQDPEFLREQADALGYPVLIKASAGGGGKGMRRVNKSGDFLAALASCQRESAASFGDDRVLIERYILQPRHIEIQVFGDRFGNMVSLFERDCSVQRRHQKVLEEAPSPGMSEERRAAMSKAAVDAARAVGYVGAGTVEFIVEQDGSFHFMEMNTRLQVEHPVTEMVTGLDVVEWQLRVANGEPLPLSQEQIQMHGHALEARIYAEDPANDFLPSTGRLIHLRVPAESRYVRIDTGVEQNDTIAPFYDPMIAKLIVWDETRELALRRISRALGEYQVVGVATNVEFLRRLVDSPSFAGAMLDTSLIERERDWLFHVESVTSKEACLIAALAVLLRERNTAQDCGERERSSPWAIRDGWRLAASLRRRLVFVQGDRRCEILVDYLECSAGAYSMSFEEKFFSVSGELRSDGEVTATINGNRVRASVVEVRGTYHVFFDGHQFVYRWMDPLAVHLEEEGEEHSLVAPMPGRVVALLVQPGERVEQGAPLLILEAMKMEYTVRAPGAGSVASFLCAAGDQVSEGMVLLEFDREA